MKDSNAEVYQCGDEHNNSSCGYTAQRTGALVPGSQRIDRQSFADHPAMRGAAAISVPLYKVPTVQQLQDRKENLNYWATIVIVGVANVLMFVLSTILHNQRIEDIAETFGFLVLMFAFGLAISNVFTAIIFWLKPRAVQTLPVASTPEEQAAQEVAVSSARVEAAVAEAENDKLFWNVMRGATVTVILFGCNWLYQWADNPLATNPEINTGLQKVVRSGSIAIAFVTVIVWVIHWINERLEANEEAVDEHKI